MRAAGRAKPPRPDGTTANGDSRHNGNATAMQRQCNGDGNINDCNDSNDGNDGNKDDDDGNGDGWRDGNGRRGGDTTATVAMGSATAHNW